jgi:hypothetical protein
MKTAEESAAQAGTSWYVYGILPADAEVAEGATGIGTRKAPLELVTADGLAALVSEVDTETLGRPEDLFDHQRLLDDVARDITVLPFRFGAVVSDREAIVTELLLPHRDEFLGTLGDVADKVEYLIRARYAEDVVLPEILEESPAARALLEEVRDLPPDAGRELRIQLGEMIGSAIESRRSADTSDLVDGISRYSTAVVEREPAGPEDAANVALLVDVARRHDLEAAVSRIADDWAPRVSVRLDGPMAPYDFVSARQAEV